MSESLEGDMIVVLDEDEMLEVEERIELLKSLDLPEYET